MRRLDRSGRDALWKLIKTRFPPSLAFPLCFLRGYRYYPYVFDMMRLLMDPARDTVDAGAHQGTYSWFFSRHSRRVYSFEPNPENFRLLSRLGPRVICYQAALSEEAGEAELRVPYGATGTVLDEGGTIAGSVQTPARSFHIRCISLDDLGLNDVGFLKVDVEGAELKVLKGARRTIATSRPKLMVEINGHEVGEARLRETVAWIEALGYDCLYFSNRRLLTFRHFNLERDQLEPVGRGDMRNYANNFVFLPAP